MPRLLFLVAVFSAALWAADVPPAAACSCAGTTDSEALARADLVFAGEVIEKRSPRTVTSSNAPALWVFRVDGVYKGRAAKTQGVYSPVSGASCGLELGPPGTEVLVFAARESRSFLLPDAPAGALQADLCNGSRSISDTPPAASLGEPVPPGAGEAGLVPANEVSRGWIAAAVIALILAAVGGAAVLGRRRLWHRRGRRASGTSPEEPPAS